MEIRRILILHDRDGVKEPYREHLSKLGCKIHLAQQMSDAYRLLKDVDPHVLILDSDSIERDNFNFCQRLNSNPPKFIRPATIIVTERNEIADVEQAVECGTDDFLNKPINPNEFLKRVENLLVLGDLRRRF